MGVVYPIAFTIEPTENIDIEILLVCFRQQAFERCGRFGKVGPVHHVAVAPLASVGEQVAANEVERRHGGLSGQFMGTRLRGRERLDDRMPEIESEFVLQEVVGIVGSDIDRNVPLLALHQKEWRWYWISCEWRDGFRTGCETILAFAY